MCHLVFLLKLDVEKHIYLFKLVTAGARIMTHMYLTFKWKNQLLRAIAKDTAINNRYIKLNLNATCRLLYSVLIGFLYSVLITLC